MTDPKWPIPKINPTPEIIEEEKELTPEQKLLWRPPTQEEINKAVESISVNTGSDTRYTAPSHMNDDPDLFSELVQKSKSEKLVDLGCSYSIDYKDDLIELTTLGIKQYVGVDLGRKNTTESTELSSEIGKIKVKFEKQEILRYLHSLPDNDANLWMMGIDIVDVMRGDFETWGMTVLREMKRVVPKNGFFVTDSLIFQWVMPKISTVKMNEENKLKYKVKENDPLYSHVKYVFDEPKLGFRIYLTEYPVELGTPAIIINTEKTLRNESDT